MTDKYYTDEEIIDFIENIGDSTHSYLWVADKVSERFARKDEHRKNICARLDEAANIIGHNTISQSMSYEN